MFNGAKSIHLIGIGGYGMSALAKLLLEMGYQVSGSDLTPSDITRHLTEMGAEIFFGHSEEHVEGRDLFVYSTAIPAENTELQAARRQGTVLHRSELLAEFLNSHKGIAVSGAHGKTTTTTMLAQIMETARLDPTALIGGEIKSFSGTAKLGKSEYLIAEADESDESFARYQPWIAVITNIEPDHLEHYDGDFSRLLKGYGRFLHNVYPEGFAIVPEGDEWFKQIRHHGRCQILTFGYEGGDYAARNQKLLPRGSEFSLYRRDEHLADIRLAVPGRHNVLNATAAAAVALELGVSVEAVVTALGKFQAAKRRFQVLADGDILIVDDYAHHPTEVKATLEAARRAGSGRVIAIFQPHRYTRTQYFMDEFATAFNDADIVILDEIYAASEKPLPGISSARLAEAMAAQHEGVVLQISGFEKIVAHVQEQCQPGDLIITMGAGDIWKVSHELAKNWHCGLQGNKTH
ncbi:MAG: UDP-N-acetylmuramate--L-alanine ligase [Firmicutes bacterium]|nr:UDP-N-acetylmuramate--L-alanine ligase [Bacillota bacterium]